MNTLDKIKGLADEDARKLAAYKLIKSVIKENSSAEQVEKLNKAISILLPRFEQSKSTEVLREYIENKATQLEGK